MKERLLLTSPLLKGVAKIAEVGEEERRDAEDRAILSFHGEASVSQDNKQKVYKFFHLRRLRKVKI